MPTKSKAKKAVPHYFKAATTQSENSPKISDTATADGTQLSLIFDRALLDFNPGKAAVKYFEMKVVVRLNGRPKAIGIYPRFAITTFKATAELTLGFWNERSRFEAGGGKKTVTDQWEPRFLCPLSLLSNTTTRTIPIVVAIKAQTGHNTGEVSVAIDSIDFEAIDE